MTHMLAKKLMVLLAAGAATTGCQSAEERTKAARETMTASCRQRTQASPTMQGVDVERFCSCVADGMLRQGAGGPPGDSVVVGERCEQQARLGV